VDEYDEELLANGHPRTLNVLAFENDRPIATTRVSLLSGSHYDQVQLQSDIQFLYDIPNGIRTRVQNVLPEMSHISAIAEMGRFTIVDAQDSNGIFHALFEGCAAIADLMGIEMLIGIMPSWMRRRMEEAGIYWELLPKFHLNRDNIEALLYMVRYFEYFFPKLNQVLPDVEAPDFTHTTRMTLYELRSIIDGVYPKDKVRLHWITPQVIYQNLTVCRQIGEKSLTPFPADYLPLRAPHITVTNPFQLEEDEVENAFYDRTYHRVVVLPDHKRFYAELTSRNYPLVSREEQERLRTARIGIAGQGTVGGNLALAMAHYGFENLRTSDPDYFDPSNLNRQPTDLFGIGQNKAEHVAYQVSCINPFMHVDVFDPIDETNLDAFVQGCDVVVSALDNPLLILGLNKAAVRHGIPVLLGTDLGSNVLLDVFDYRQTSELMHGRVSDDDLALPMVQVVLKIIGLENIPLEMLNAFQMRLDQEIDYFAQTIVAANVCSSMLIEGISHVLLDKPIKHTASVDVLDVVMQTNAQSYRREQWEARLQEMLQILA
jgi:molybdopterin/thiamine biosynthesis adenylyltransferase